MCFLPGLLKLFAIHYLGIHLSIHKPRKCQHLVDKVMASLPTWKACGAPQQGRANSSSKDQDVSSPSVHCHCNFNLTMGVKMH